MRHPGACTAPAPTAESQLLRPVPALLMPAPYHSARVPVAGRCKGRAKLQQGAGVPASGRSKRLPAPESASSGGAASWHSAPSTTAVVPACSLRLVHLPPSRLTSALAGTPRHQAADSNAARWGRWGRRSPGGQPPAPAAAGVVCLLDRHPTHTPPPHAPPHGAPEPVRRALGAAHRAHRRSRRRPPPRGWGPAQRPVVLRGGERWEGGCSAGGPWGAGGGPRGPWARHERPPAPPGHPRARARPLHAVAGPQEAGTGVGLPARPPEPPAPPAPRRRPQRAHQPALDRAGAAPPAGASSR